MSNTKISSGTVHTLPRDMEEALRADPAALIAWEDITSLARNEWICWTISVKKEETRKDHVQRVVSELKKACVVHAAGQGVYTGRIRY